ncbi:hypothetical protein [Gramella sp. AN32]|uniref:Uncharacterized protein n=1 Tax=Christiangramia antarctica TaxID=2058158 RepID=A0ABW5WZQ0_9FLAO|nr:hypothetical protein [Gramella sp. AN32]MCM4155070.1 hypothetical protein [Gramella sp. AN32]
MDTSSVIIGLFLFGLFFFPIIYALIRQHAIEKKKNNLLFKYAGDNKLTLTETESIGHLNLGLDTQAKKLIILENKEKPEFEIIDLHQVGKVQVSKQLFPGKTKNKKEKIMHLRLELENKIDSKVTAITFYDEDDADSTDAEIRLHEAKKWDELLHKNLAS